MKTQLLKKSLILLFLVGLVSACSSDSSDGGGDDNNNTNNNTNQVTSITIEATATEVLQGSSVVFTVRDNNNNNITSQSTIYVAGTTIPVWSYAFNQAGSFEVYAEYNTLTSSSLTVNAIAPTHTTKVMVEDYTGTWCGYCPRLAHALEQTVALNANVIPVALHDDEHMPFPGVATLENTFGITGFPSGRINRTISWNESTSQPIDYLSEIQPLGLAINSSLSGNTISAEIKVHFDISVDDDLKLVVYLMENGLVYPQVNYYNEDSSSPFYQQGDPITDFVHNHTARIALTDSLGDAIPATENATNNTYTVNFSQSVPTTVQNSNNLELVAFVVGSNRTVINVQQANLGVNQDFD